MSLEKYVDDLEAAFEETQQDARRWKAEARKAQGQRDEMLAELRDLLAQVAASGHGPQFITDDAYAAVDKVEGQS